MTASRAPRYRTAFVCCGRVFLLYAFVLVCSLCPAWAQIAINELQPNPVAPEPEWVEVLNLGSTEVRLENLYLRDASKTRYALALLVIPAHGFAILTKDTATLKSLRSIPSSAVLHQMSSFPSLNVSKESVYLTTKDSVVLDSLYYEKSVPAGISLERIDPTKPALNDVNLATCLIKEGATCGYANSNAPLDVDAQLQRLYVDSPRQALVAVVHNAGRQPIAQATLSLFLGVRALRSYTVNSLAVNDSVAFSYPLDSLRFVGGKPGEFPCMAVINQPNDQRHLNDTARLTVFLSYTAQSIVLNEFMFDPLSGNSEFIEFYNPGSDTLNMQSLSLHDASSTVLTINSPLSVPPKGYGVIATDSSFLVQFPALRGMSNVLVQKSSFSLNSDGDPIVLRDPNGMVLDSLSYSSNWHLPGLAITKGTSLEKVNVSLTSAEKNSWTSCADNSGATPAAVNSVARDIVQQGSLSATPNPFSPRSSVGSKQTCIISYALPFKQARVHADVYDVNGQKIRNIANNLYSAAQGAFVWDGRNEENFAMSSGAYIIALEAIDTQSGATHQDKMLLVIGE